MDYYPGETMPGCDDDPTDYFDDVLFCEICKSENNVQATDVALQCCEECRKLFGFIAVEEPKEAAAPDDSGRVAVP